MQLSETSRDGLSMQLSEPARELIPGDFKSLASRTRYSAMLVAILLLAGCKKGEGSGMSFQTVGKQPDVAPVMLNKELPFRYPPALYAQKVQGNVTLRIFIDREGVIVSDSTRIAETSGFTALDSAAMKGSRELKFDPAKTQGVAVPVSILLPVFFRHPDAPPLAGDSVIKRDTPATASSTPTLKPDTVKTPAKAPAKAPARKTTRRTTR